jgi:hypothetical protein
MTTTVAPEVEQDHSASQEWPTLAPDLPDTPRDDRADWFDPTQGRKIGHDPYDDPTQGRRIGSDPHDDPTQGRKIGARPYDDPTRGRRIGSNPYDDPTQGRKIGSEPHDDATRGAYDTHRSLEPGGVGPASPRW